MMGAEDETGNNNISTSKDVEVAEDIVASRENSNDSMANETISSSLNISAEEDPSGFMSKPSSNNRSQTGIHEDDLNLSSAAARLSINSSHDASGTNAQSHSNTLAVTEASRALQALQTAAATDSVPNLTGTQIPSKPTVMSSSAGGTPTENGFSNEAIASKAPKGAPMVTGTASPKHNSSINNQNNQNDFQNNNTRSNGTNDGSFQKINDSKNTSASSKIERDQALDVSGEVEEEDESSEISASDEDGSWIAWFCSLRGNEFFCEVDEDYIQDDFNLTGLSTIVPYYEYALDMVLDVEMPMEENLNEEQQEIVESAAEMLYGLIHARYIVTNRGMHAMYEKYRSVAFGRCPNVFCQGQPVLPVGLSDLARNYTVNVFCPRCHGLFFPKSTRQANIDGAYFGTTFPHLYLMTHPVSISYCCLKSIMSYSFHLYFNHKPLSYHTHHKFEGYHPCEAKPTIQTACLWF